MQNMAVGTRRDPILVKVGALLVPVHPDTDAQVVPRPEVSDRLIWGINHVKAIAWMHESVK